MTQATAEVVAELTRLYRELPPRPSEEELKEAAAVLASADEEEEARLAEVDGEVAARAREGVPAELLDVLREARRNAVRLRALQQRKEAAHVVELGRRFKIFDELRQRASRVVSPGDGGGGGGDAAYAVDEVVEVEAKRRPELAAAVATAASEIDRGSKGGLGFETKSVSSLRRAASAGITPLLRVYVFVSFSPKLRLISHLEK